MNDALNADRRQQKRRGQGSGEDFRAQVALRDIAKHSRDKLPAMEGFAIRANSFLAAGATCDVIVGFGFQNFLGGLFEERKRDGNRDTAAC